MCYLIRVVDLTKTSIKKIKFIQPILFILYYSFLRLFSSFEHLSLRISLQPLAFVLMRLGVSRSYFSATTSHIKIMLGLHSLCMWLHQPTVYRNQGAFEIHSCKSVLG